MSLQVLKQPELASKSEVPQTIIDLYYQIEKEISKRRTWNALRENELWSELCLCILASNVPFEQAQSATQHLQRKNFLDPFWILETSNSWKIISYELSKQICLPRKKDGTLRKYRFPNVRAKNIVRASSFLYSEKNNLKNLLQNFESETIAREFLVHNISGLGLKEASHFLRNIGFAQSLAIIDVHIISFLMQLGLISEFPTLTDKKYFELEDKMQKLANFYGFNLAILDNAIWNYMKYRM